MAILRECRIGRAVPAAELQLVCDLMVAWYPARFLHKKVVLGTLKEPGKAPCDVSWVPNYGVICPCICTSNGSWMFLVECCEPGTVFCPASKKDED